MKYSVIILIFLASGITSCKKGKNQPPDNGVPGKPAPEWVHYTTSNSGLTDNQINGIAVDRNDVKWFATANGIAKFSNSGWATFTTANSPLPSDYVRAISVGNDGVIWAGTADGLVKLEGDRWQVYTTGNSVMENHVVSAITYDPKTKTTWVGTDDGILKINDTEHWEVIPTNGLVISLATDSHGDLWAGLFNPFAFVGRISKWSHGKWQTHNLPDLGYPSAFPFSLTTDSQDNLIAALSGTSVRSVIRLKDDSWQELNSPHNVHGIRAIALQNEKIWVGGTSLTNFAAEKLTPIAIPEVKSSIQVIVVDKMGRKWIGTQLDGVAVYTD